MISGAQMTTSLFQTTTSLKTGFGPRIAILCLLGLAPGCDEELLLLNSDECPPNEICDSSSQLDGGLPPSDSGSSTLDVGLPPLDSGSSVLDSGSLNSDASTDLADTGLFADAQPSQPMGAITSLDCARASFTGSLVVDVDASGNSFELRYTGGNGGAHNGQSVNSTGVTGLTATLNAGNFSNGNGVLNYALSGTPVCSGTASFELNIGEQTCTVDLLVTSTPAPTVYCSGSPTPVIEVTSPTGRIWMDRNLGARNVATSVTDNGAYGDLYQWGRGTDGHQCRNSPTTSTLSCTDHPMNGDFIVATNPPDWRNPPNSNLWQGVNGTNNPCPSGFRIPTQAEFDQERQSWATNNAAGAYGSVLKLTMGGGRTSDGGAFQAVDINGYYWTSTIDFTLNLPRYLGFFSGAASLDLSQQAFGLSVRCIKD